MAADLKKLERLCGGLHQLFSYLTDDSISACAASGYFNGATDWIRKGDFILIAAEQDATEEAALLMVSSESGAATVTTVQGGTGGGVTATAAELNEYTLTVDVADFSAEASYWVVAPHAGDISKIYTVIAGAVATADVTVTAKIGGVAVTNGVVTIATAGSAAGDVDVATPTAARTVTAGQAIELVVTGGGSGGTPKGRISVVIAR